MKMAVLTMWSPEFATMAEPVHEVRELYCVKHGYEVIAKKNIVRPGVHMGWLKFFVIQEVMKETDADYIFWNDADAVIWNHDFKLEDLIDEKYDLLVAFDGEEGPASWRPQSRRPLDCINVGNMIIKNDKTRKSFLADLCTDKRYEYWYSHPYWEQTALEEYIHDHPDFHSRVKVLKPKNTFNFADGPFLRHALGFHLTPQVKGQMLREYMRQIRISGIDYDLSYLYNK